MHIFNIRIDSDACNEDHFYYKSKGKSRYYSHVHASMGAEHLQGFCIPLSRIPTVVRNRINMNTLIVIHTEKDYDPEEILNNPELLPYENGVYFDMIWKSH